MNTPTPPTPHASSIENHLPAIESLLGKIVAHGGFDLKFSFRRAGQAAGEQEAAEVVVEFMGPDSELLLASGGSLLDALEYLVLRAARVGEDVFGRITFDCQDFRRLRTEELRLMAEMAAGRVAETREPFAFNPMPARERRIVHLALKGNLQVRTASEGIGRERRVIIHPAAEPPAAGPGR